ncbi:MAG TPA: hypothetical protein PKH24_15010 [Sedimentisphaerales bacterium]|jgi:hypothetical protein|nr:hypothetical protein [Sedimentisphaerales bacterium]HNU31853.1 hypothetical protein [Sedimentisphaerales bacterium]
MTLLLAAKCEKGIILMADGLCRGVNPDGTSSVLSDEIQKLFPLGGRPIIIAHHGQNVLNGRPVVEYITRIAPEVDNARTVANIADYVEQSLDGIVRNTLAGLAASGINSGCGFWIAGYGPDDSTATLIEVFWEPM